MEKKLVGANTEVLLNHPTTIWDILNTHPWFHPLLANTSGAGARTWGSGIWRKLWDNNVRVIGDLWDASDCTIKVPETLNPREKAAATKLIKMVIKIFPLEWQTILHKRTRDADIWRRPEAPLKQLQAVK